MLPRVSDMRAPAPLHNELTAELRLRGFQGDLAPAFGDRIVSATDNSIYQLLPAARSRFRATSRPGAHRARRGRARASRTSSSRLAAAEPAPTASR